MNKVNLGKATFDITPQKRRFKTHVFCVWRSLNQASQDAKMRASLDEELVQQESWLYESMHMEDGV